MHVNGQDTVSKLKEKIFLFQGIPQQSQRLVFSGKDLQDAQTLQASAVSKDSEVALLLHRREVQIYVIALEGQRMTLECDLDDTVYSLKKGIQKKTGIPVEHMRLIFAGIELYGDLRTLRECKVTEDTMMHLLLRLRGGDGVDFNALDDKDKVVRKFVDDAPDWRCVVDGLNFEAVCKTPGCDAYQKEVWVQKGYGKFDVLQEIFEGAICPLCKKNTEDPMNIGLSNCIAEVEGKMIKPVKKSVKKIIEAEKGSLTTFKEGAKANWMTLTINVTKV